MPSKPISKAPESSINSNCILVKNNESHITIGNYNKIAELE